MTNRRHGPVGLGAAQAWNARRETLPPGPYFCVNEGPTSGRPMSASMVREQLRTLQRRCGIRRRIAPHQLRHCHAVELVREGAPVYILQRQLGHANLAVTTVYLSSVAPEVVLAIAHQRRQPTVQITNLLE